MARVRSGLIVFWLAVASIACGGNAEKEGAASGVVRGVDVGKARVTLEHGDIPGLMRAMTMAFDVADPELLTGLEVGREVDFRVRYADGKYTVVDIEPR